MNPGYTPTEIENIRKLVQENNEPADSSLLEFIQHDLNETKDLIRKYLSLLKDFSVPTNKICNIFNDPTSRSTPSPRRSPRLAPKPVDVNFKKERIPAAPLSASSLSIPPKFRGKSMPKTPNGRINPSPFSEANISSNGKTNANSNLNGKISKIPVLPKCESSPAAIAHHKQDNEGPEISSLAAVLHQSLGPANVCRVLASCERNRTPYYLVAFFQPDNSPCYVPKENLFQLKSNIGFPLGNEEEFRREMQESDISVDFLLERIFSSAQNLVINHAEVLFPQDVLKKMSFFDSKKIYPSLDK